MKINDGNYYLLKITDWRLINNNDDCTLMMNNDNQLIGDKLRLIDE
jgi:hypothetical protein